LGINPNVYLLNQQSQYRQKTDEEKRNAEILELLKQRYVKNYAIWAVAQFNTKVYLNKYWRYYWIGDRYYDLVNSPQSPTKTPSNP
jgi:hypothetical protein